VKLGENATINIATQHPEFMGFKFVNVDEVLNMTAHFKKPVYEKVVSHFRNEGLL